jgi:hypothetical protein
MSEGLTSNPLHQELQFLPGQVGAWPVMDPTEVVRASEPTAQACPRLQRHNPALQEVADHVHRCQAVGRQDLILSSMGSNSNINNNLALHCFLSSLGPSLGSTRWSLASVLAITHSVCQFSHLTPLREEI